MEVNRLYLRPWDYNCARLLETLADKVHQAGGVTKDSPPVEICERSNPETTAITVKYRNYIAFKLQGMYYYYQLDDNPLFDFFYIKTPIVNNRYSKDAVGDIDTKAWWLDDLLKSNCTDQVIEVCATSLFSILRNLPVCKIQRTQKKVSVSNMFNNGYHYEYVDAPERLVELNF